MEWLSAVLARKSWVSGQRHRLGLTARKLRLVSQGEVASLLEHEIRRHLTRNVRKNKEYVAEMTALLDAARSLERNLSTEVASSVKRMIGDFKEEIPVRKAALLAYASIAVPTKQVADYLTTLFTSPPPNMTLELVQTLEIFAANCRQSVEYVIACVEVMSALRDVATQFHRSITLRKIVPDKDLVVTELRQGIHGISQIILAFEEFIQRSSVRGSILPSNSHVAIA